MLWINYLDTGSERVHTSLEGSLRMEGWRGGGDEEEVWRMEGWFQVKIHSHPSLLKPRPAQAWKSFKSEHSSMKMGQQVKPKTGNVIKSEEYLIFSKIQGGNRETFCNYEGTHLCGRKKVFTLYFIINTHRTYCQAMPLTAASYQTRAY